MPFNIRNADRTLLLARGQVITSESQLEALFERGALVDADELKGVRALIMEASAERLPAMWGECMNRVGRMLRASDHQNFNAALDEAAKPVIALIERDPDLAIFQLVQQGAEGKTQYGVTHSMHTAIASYLVAQRLGWEEPEMRRVFKAALTMNLSMIELQTRLATQVTPLTMGQREHIRSHPLRSVEMLQASGIDDDIWLRAVEQHHEEPDGNGYPHRLREITDAAQLLRRTDMYTAKLSARVTRSPVAANEAGRLMFMRDHGHPMTAAIVKEFGLYPPGCYVRLASGEAGVVVKRGPSANTPIVAALTNRQDEPLVEPVRRNTAQREHAVVGVLAERAIRVRVSPDRLVVVARA